MYSFIIDTMGEFVLLQQQRVAKIKVPDMAKRYKEKTLHHSKIYTINYINSPKSLKSNSAYKMLHSLTVRNAHLCWIETAQWRSVCCCCVCGLLGAVLAVQPDSSRREGPVIPLCNTPGPEQPVAEQALQCCQGLMQGWGFFMDDSLAVLLKQTEVWRTFAITSSVKKTKIQQACQQKWMSPANRYL